MRAIWHWAPRDVGSNAIKVVHQFDIDEVEENELIGVVEIGHTLKLPGFELLEAEDFMLGKGTMEGD